MVIYHSDNINIHDSSTLTMKKNFAKIFINNRLVDIVTNMVVASGRAFVAQRLVGLPSDSEDLTNYKVSHFGIGSGGSTILDTQVVLQGPDMCDIDNYNPIQIDPGNNMFLTSPAGVENAVKPITLDGSIQIIENTNISCSDTNLRKSLILCTCVIAPGEPTWLQPGDAIKVDEAALYYVNPDTRDAKTFARITFFPKFIEKETTFTILWYIIC